MVTWKEFKIAAERQGIRDDDIVAYIDWSALERSWSCRDLKRLMNPLRARIE